MDEDTKQFRDQFVDTGIRLYEADNEVLRAETERLETKLLLLSGLPHAERLRSLYEQKRPFAVERVAIRKYRPEHCAYDWRRDYGEWPTWMNLADRLARYAGINRQEAEERISVALNDPGPGSYLWALPPEDAEAILENVPRVRTLEDTRYLPNLETYRIYVSAEGIEALACHLRYEMTPEYIDRMIK